MNKKVLILLLLIFVTGCEASYTLSYENDLFVEDIEIKNFYDDGDGEGEPGVDYYMSEPIYFDIDQKYKYEVQSDKKFNGNYNLGFSGVYNEIPYVKSYILNECVEYYKFEETDELIYISAYGEYYCYSFDSLSINFKTDKSIIYSNAHKESNGKLTWNYEYGDYIDITIEINKLKNKSINFSFLYYIIGFAILLLVSYFGIRYYNIYKENRMV